MADGSLSDVADAGSDSSSSSYNPLASPSPSLVPSAASSSAAFLVYTGIYACGALYLVPCVIAWRRVWLNRQSDMTAVKLFSLLGLGAFFRAAAFLLVAVWMFLVARAHGDMDDATSLHLTYLEIVFLWQLLGMFGACTLSCVFLLVFNTWASMVEQVSGGGGANSGLRAGGSRSGVLVYGTAGAGHGRLSSRNASAPSSPRVLFIKMVLSVYALQLVTFLLQHRAPDSIMCRSMYLVATLLLGCCFIVCMFLMPAYGSRMCNLLSRVAEGAPQRQRNIRRIAAIATVFCLMRMLSLLLLAVAEYGRENEQILAATAAHTSASSSSSSGSVVVATGDASKPKTLLGLFPISEHSIMEQNPIFFFSWATQTTVQGVSTLVHWVVLLEVVEFPLEWALLMALLYVLPSRSAVPSIRGYQSLKQPWRS